MFGSVKGEDLCDNERWGRWVSTSAGLILWNTQPSMHTERGFTLHCGIVLKQKKQF